jgi:hypothetical protein
MFARTIDNPNLRHHRPESPLYRLVGLIVGLRRQILRHLQSLSDRIRCLLLRLLLLLNRLQWEWKENLYRRLSRKKALKESQRCLRIDLRPRVRVFVMCRYW